MPVANPTLNIGASEPARSDVPDSTTSDVIRNPASTTIPQHSMSRGISTVSELWTEWHVGLSTHPSIEYLDQTYGCKWRSSSKEAKFYSRRHYVIKYVRSLVNRGLSIESALKTLSQIKGNEVSTHSRSTYVARERSEC